MKQCINYTCYKYDAKRKNHCRAVPYRISVEGCECHADDPHSPWAVAYRKKVAYLLNKRNMPRHDYLLNKVMKTGKYEKRHKSVIAGVVAATCMEILRYQNPLKPKKSNRKGAQT